jgi:hypothetical protein
VAAYNARFTDRLIVHNGLRARRGCRDFKGLEKSDVIFCFKNIVTICVKSQVFMGLPPPYRPTCER